MQKKYKPDGIEHLEESSLVQLSRDLLEATVESTKILKLEEMTPQKLQEAKLVLGFLNAADKTMRTKIQFFKMTNIEEKVRVARERSKKL